MNSRTEKVSKILKQYIYKGNCGLFFTKNTCHDKMDTIYIDYENDIRVDICYDWCYFEVFGLNEEEKNKISDYYGQLLSEIDRRYYYGD